MGMMSRDALVVDALSEIKQEKSDVQICADPLAEDFNPSAHAPPELSSWLYLFYSYLKLEEAYAEVAEWLKFVSECAHCHLPRQQSALNLFALSLDAWHQGIPRHQHHAEEHLETVDRQLV